MSATPSLSTPRPPVPKHAANPLLADLEDAPHPVKYQVITRENQEIVIGRLKIPTPGGHAFILRRFDTGAISLSTMFKVAFPAAAEDLEKAECSWIKANFDISGANGGGRLRLAGTWVPPAVASYAAPSYGLGNILPPLVSAVPDPTISYRKSTRNTSGAPMSPAPPPYSPPTAPASPTHVAKRRRESPSTPSVPVASNTLLTTTTTTRVTRTSISPGKSPSRLSASPNKISSTKVSSTTTVAAPITPTQANTNQPDDAPDVPVLNPEEDIAEAKDLVAVLKAAHAARDAAAVAVEADIGTTETMMDSSPVKGTSLKRALEELSPAKEPAPRENGEGSAVNRVIATNKRIQVTPQNKSLGVGLLAFTFTFAAGALYLAPSFI